MGLGRRREEDKGIIVTSEVIKTCLSSKRNDSSILNGKDDFLATAVWVCVWLCCELSAVGTAAAKVFGL